MTFKRFKKIGFLLVCMIYLATACLSSFSFAAEVSDVNKNVEEGKYYIKNKGTSLYMSSLDFYSIVQTSFSGNDMQKWELEYVSEGYYRVKNVYSGYYLTATGTLTAGDAVNEQSLSSTNNAQLWNFTALESGQFATYKEYKISAKTHENTNLALASYDILTSYGYPVIQDNYSSDFELSDEWVLIPIQDACVIGISYTSLAHDHTSVLPYVASRLEGKFYDVNYSTPSIGSVHTITTSMENSDLFIIRGCGGADVVGTWITLEEGSVSNILHAYNIYNYNGHTGIDMSGCKLALFVGCYTAETTYKSLPYSAVCAGAECSLGFTGNVDCLEASDWLDCFVNYYVSGETVEISAEDAFWDAGASEELETYVIFTEPVFSNP